MNIQNNPYLKNYFTDSHTNNSNQINNQVTNYSNNQTHNQVTNHSNNQTHNQVTNHSNNQTHNQLTNHTQTRITKYIPEYNDTKEKAAFVSNNQSYSTNWNILDSVLFYSDKSFEFRPKVIILEIDNCLIKYISKNDLYDTFNTNKLEIYAHDFMQRLTKETVDTSIIVISNQINRSKYNIDSIKKKFEHAKKILNKPLLGLFALDKNKFMKPHTGLYLLLQGYYKKYGFNITDTRVISNEGGIIENVVKKGDNIQKVIYSDVDRAFANNIDAVYYTIDEYMTPRKKTPFKWNSEIISPETRDVLYQEIMKLNTSIKEICAETKATNIIMKKPSQNHIAKYSNQLDNAIINIFTILQEMRNTSEIFIIFILGPPRSGKTRFTRQLIRYWRNSKFGDKNAIECIQPKAANKKQIKLFEMLIKDRISIVIDGSCHTEALRKPFLDKSNDIPVLFIEINTGIELAKLFNHVCVEEAKDHMTRLYDEGEYLSYRGTYEAPKVDVNMRHIYYFPDIELKPSVMNYRY
jgi:hypothetical protein